MSQHYSDPSREEETYSLPDVETFYMSAREFLRADEGTWMADARDAVDGGDPTNVLGCSELAGWYYWYCFPGCLPDSEPSGPYATEQEAIDACRDENT